MDIYYQSEKMSFLVDTAKKYARSDSNVLLMGESGTGKELFAQAIHNSSGRKDGPFVAINCGALNSNLLESELFGYEEGAFTGALKGGKRGLFEAAHKGTLFLDEIADAPLPVQQKLLRAIQEREIIRVSGTKPIYVDVRIIAATNKNILEEVEKGTFRHDLFYRLNVLPLRIPSLRERVEDVPCLFEYLLAISLKAKGIPFPADQINEGLKQMLCAHSWPGNIREMVNLVEVVTNGLELGDNERLEAIIRRYWEMLYYRGRDSLFSAAPELKKQQDSLPQLDSSTEQVLDILSLLERNGKTPGRSAVFRYCSEEGISLSEQQIKLRINRLKELGLLESAEGYGNRITERGRNYLSR